MPSRSAIQASVASTRYRAILPPKKKVRAVRPGTPAELVKTRGRP